MFHHQKMGVSYSFLLTLILHSGVGDGIAHTLSTSRPANIAAASFIDNDSTSLSNLLSSAKRYAEALNMTEEQVQQKKVAYEQVMEALHQKLASDSVPGLQKHILMCQHRVEYGCHPFVCPRCWSYLPVCVCSLVPSEKVALPGNVSVVVWTHHREWGLTSNTGGLLGIMLQDCHILMKGLPEHDSKLDDFIQNPDNLVVVLWPDQNNVHEGTEDGKTKTRYVSLEQERNESQLKHIVLLIAVDGGTWRNARRMVARLPRSKIVFADLLKESVQKILIDTENKKTNYRKGAAHSLLAPLRGRGPNIGENHVCTTEAVTGALLQLGIKESDTDHFLSVARQKVNLICRYRAKVTLKLILRTTPCSRVPSELKLAKRCTLVTTNEGRTHSCC